VPGALDDPDEQPVEAEVVDRGAGEGDMPVVRRVEGTAEEP
jgi:hypothetical protein